MIPRMDSLTQALRLLASEMSILPATGGAVEDLQHPDPDEIEDALINRDSGDITEFLETPKPDVSSLYRATPPLYRTEDHFFRFFIDGSLRTSYLATGVEGNRSFPIELPQIGAGVVKRNDDGKVRPLGVHTRILLLIPRGQFGVSDTVWNQIKRLDSSDGYFEVVDTTQKNVNAPQEPTVESLRTRAGGIARNRMHKLEIEMIKLTDDERCQQSWLILDGAVKLDEFVSTPNMIGVAKSFRKDPEFKFGRGPNKRLDITSIL